MDPVKRTRKRDLSRAPAYRVFILPKIMLQIKFYGHNFFGSYNDIRDIVSNIIIVQKDHLCEVVQLPIQVVHFMRLVVLSLANNHWTRKHIDWINTVSFSEPLLQDTLKEYMIEYNHLCNRVETLDKQIKENIIKRRIFA